MAKRASDADAIIPHTKVKKIMQEDEQIGRVSEHCSYLVARSAQLFANDLLAAAFAEATARGVTKVTMQDLRAAVGRKEMFDFVKDAVFDSGHTEQTQDTI